MSQQEMIRQGWRALVLENGQYLPDTANVRIPAGLLRRLLFEIEMMQQLEKLD